MVGSSQTWLFQPGCFTVLCGSAPFALVYALLRSFVGLHLRPFAICCAHLRISASDRV